MKTFKFFMPLVMVAFIGLTSCDNDDDNGIEPPMPTEFTTTYALSSVAVPEISGTATFTKNTDDTTTITLALENTPDDGMHPAHIHFNTAAEGGDIALTLGTVEGDTGIGMIRTATLDDGTAISYEELIVFDGYINVHLSPDDLSTLVAQGDIGQNQLTGAQTSYDLGSVAVDDIEGDVTFSERVNGEALAVITLEGTPEGGMHPAHIHANTAAESGDILFTFNPVNGDTGVSKTNLAAFDDETSFSYADVIDIDGYVNVHLSADDLGTLVAQGDIGQNDLTGETKAFALAEVAVDGIDGDVTFSERINGEALAIITLSGTPDGGMHPAHIHANTAAEGGDIIFSFNPVNGDTGVSKTNLAEFDDKTSFLYADVLDIDGYVNVHLSADELGTLVAQGDIGQNELTGESTTYVLEERAVPGISGDATFFERANGTALAILTLDGTSDGDMHPAHIHTNDAETGGPIVFSFPPVDGTTGTSKVQVEALDDDSAIGYNDILTFDGYINVHLSADDLGTLVAQGNIGSNI